MAGLCRGVVVSGHPGGKWLCLSAPYSPVERLPRGRVGWMLNGTHSLCGECVECKWQRGARRDGVPIRGAEIHVV